MEFLQALKSRHSEYVLSKNIDITEDALTSYLKDYLVNIGQDRDKVRGYRGGYLPNLRREIEKGLKDGKEKTYYE